MRGRPQRILVGVIAIVALAMPERATRAESAAGELVVIVNAANPARPSAAMLEKIFLRKEMACIYSFSTQSETMEFGDSTTITN